MMLEYQILRPDHAILGVPRPMSLEPAPQVLGIMEEDMAKRFAVCGLRFAVCNVSGPAAW